MTNASSVFSLHRHIIADWIQLSVDCGHHWRGFRNSLLGDNPLSQAFRHFRLLATLDGRDVKAGYNVPR
ncbi:hypothetical protein GGD56_000162 [Rhizobium mongolense]|uniref:Uncharacterized protein n=1 Tax=Rhizobium mongolense TaxID=57676 RepID=A0ABR6IEP2_9HYPH|nr:hypothetical protein [Rhizobium mongolense]